MCPKTPTEFFGTAEDETTFTVVHLIETMRYNPSHDAGPNNMCWFKSNKKVEVNWMPPDNPELTNENLPFWLLLWGFTDWHRKIKKMLHLDSDYILTCRYKPNDVWTYFVPISDSFYNGQSPYEGGNKPNKADAQTWYPQLQYQNEIINTICRTGPGTTKIPDNYTVQGLMEYCFYFKWGGSPPPMSAIEEPTTQPTYIIPGNIFQTNSLQNPATNPETLLWSFDQRRHEITPTAIKRLQKYQTTETTSITGGSNFQETTPYQQTTPTETSSEEEEEDLYQQLLKQRQKQQRLRLRIIQTLTKMQQLE